tara:strand:+ start:408 stop:641 length:234 start_codon:yes stop_codon:yes gene_type:complete
MKIDIHTHTWQAVMGWATKEVAALHVALEEPGLSLALTEQHRGAIAMLRDLASLPETLEKPAPAQIIQEDTGYGLGV